MSQPAAHRTQRDQGAFKSHSQWRSNGDPKLKKKKNKNVEENSGKEKKMGMPEKCQKTAKTGNFIKNK